MLLPGVTPRGALPMNSTQLHLNLLFSVLILSAVAHPETKEARARIAPHSKGELCIKALPDGLPIPVPPLGIWHDSARDIAVFPYAKKPGAKNWNPCSRQSNDLLRCDDIEGAFQHYDYDLEPTGRFQRSACWTFVNDSGENLEARIIAKFKVQRLSPGFVLYRRAPGDRSAFTVSIKAACVCVRAKEGFLTAYSTEDLVPSRDFYAKRGDIISVQAAGRGNYFGIPEGCDEVPTGTFNIRITRIHPFPQPADYSMVIEGQITNDPPSDKSQVFDDLGSPTPSRVIDGGVTYPQAGPPFVWAEISVAPGGKTKAQESSIPFCPDSRELQLQYVAPALSEALLSKRYSAFGNIATQGGVITSAIIEELKKQLVKIDDSISGGLADVVTTPQFPGCGTVAYVLPPHTHPTAFLLQARDSNGQYLGCSQFLSRNAPQNHTGRDYMVCDVGMAAWTFWSPEQVRLDVFNNWSHGRMRIGYMKVWFQPD